MRPGSSDAPRWIVRLTLVAGVAAWGCKPNQGTEQPGAGDLAAYEGEGATPKPGQGESGADGAKSEQELPKVRDRDPEEEKRKMAQSRQRSAKAEQMLRGGQLQQAVAQSREALKIHEQNVDAMLVIAEVFYRQKKYELTHAVTTSALAVDEKIRTPQQTSRAHNLKGFAQLAMGRDSAATQSFKKAAETDDKNASAWNNLGTRYLEAGDIATAQSCFDYAIELRPSFAKAHLNRGAALRAQKKWKDAEKSLLRALELKRSYPEAYFNLGVLYLDADPFPGLETLPRLQKAISYLEKYKSTSSGTASTDVARRRTVKGKPGAKPGPAPVSSARADDYIRVANKGIDRIKRREERDRERQAKAAQAGAAEDGGDEPASTSSEPQKPGDAPSQGAKGDADSGAQTPSKPAAQQPAPKKPTTTKPAPQQPPAQKDGTQDKPAQKEPDEKPAPKKPPAQQPKPQQPKPQQPKTGQPDAPTTKQPSPQQPKPQKPQPQRPGQKNASAWNPLRGLDTNVVGTPSRSPKQSPATEFGQDGNGDTRMTRSRAHPAVVPPAARSSAVDSHGVQSRAAVSSLAPLSLWTRAQQRVRAVMQLHRPLEVPASGLAPAAASPSKAPNRKHRTGST